MLGMPRLSEHRAHGTCFVGIRYVIIHDKNSHQTSHQDHQLMQAALQYQRPCQIHINMIKLVYHVHLNMVSL